MIPEIEFRDIRNGDAAAATRFREEVRKRGVAVVRNVVEDKEALKWKEDIRSYIKANPSTKGIHFPFPNKSTHSPKFRRT